MARSLSQFASLSSSPVPAYPSIASLRRHCGGSQDNQLKESEILGERQMALHPLIQSIRKIYYKRSGIGACETTERHYQLPWDCFNNSVQQAF